MPKKVSSKRTREDLKPRPPPVPEKLASYADRIKLRADEPAGPEELKAVKVMTDIFDKKKIAASEATCAIREARDAAKTHQKSLWHYKNRRAAVKRALKDLDELILKIEGLEDAISALPLTSKVHLKRKTADLVKRSVFDTDLVKEGVFDTDLFFDLINLIRDCLLDLSPEKRADDARSIIEPGKGESSPRILILWERIPAIMREDVEQRIRRIKSSPSCIELLRVLLDRLLKLRQTRRPGAPRSLQSEYVEAIDSIWLRLNLTGRRLYYVGSKRATDKERHVQSPFQRFCIAALTSVGDPTQISVRQVSDLKRRRPPKRRKRRKPRSSV
jgi:hypothetical protein